MSNPQTAFRDALAALRAVAPVFEQGASVLSFLSPAERAAALELVELCDVVSDIGAQAVREEAARERRIRDANR